MRFFRPGFLTRILYPGALFRVKTSGKVVYLTFDDGPDPDSTSIVIQILQKHGIRSLFFCGGETAAKNPDLVNLIRSKGHLLGNHGYKHLNGWITSSGKYIANADKASEFTSGTLFRPPYGSLSPVQFLKLRERFRIVFWDLMPYDFDRGFGSTKSLAVLIRMIRPGSVIVLHDKKGSNAVSFLDEFIVSAKAMGYIFGLPEDLKS